MKIHRKLFKNLVILLVFPIFLAGCGLNDEKLSKSGPTLDAGSKPTEKKESVYRGIEVQAAEEKIDRSNPNWMKQYCVSRILEIGMLPSSYERQRGPFIAMNPVYLSDRHIGYDDKVTCTLDYYIWPVRVESFSSMQLDYAYSIAVWEDYYSALTASTSGILKQEGWKELVNNGDIGVVPDYSMSYRNTSENLREYLDVFYTNDEEVVYELLIIDLD